MISQTRSFKETIRTSLKNGLIGFFGIFIGVFIQTSFLIYGHLTGFFVVPMVFFCFFWVLKKLETEKKLNRMMEQKKIDWYFFGKIFFLWAFIGTLIIALMTGVVMFNEEYVIVKRSVWNEFYSK